MFIVGQKVVCINDTFPPDIHREYEALPKKDSVYVIRGVALGICRQTGTEGEVTVYLVGLNNPPHKGVGGKPGPERGFNCERFAPLEEDLDSSHNEDFNTFFDKTTPSKKQERELVEV